MKTAQRSRVAILAVLTVLVLASAATAAPAPLNALLSVDDPADTADGRVRVLHASPHSPAVDLWVDGDLAVTGLGFGEMTEYLSLPAGSYQIQVEPSGRGGQGPFYVDVLLTLGAGTDFTVVAADILAQATPVILKDGGQDPAAGFGHLRFFHGSPDARAVDVAVTGGPVLFADVVFQQDTAYLPIAAGSYDLEVRWAGGDEAILTLPGVTVPAGAMVTAFATGLVADGAADRTLYLEDDRFRIEVAWADFAGHAGFGRPNRLQGTTANFWFFDPENIELTFKVLDGRAVNGHFWVFFGSLSNVEFTIDVTDTVTGATKVYRNPMGSFASIGDPQAFAGR